MQVMDPIHGHVSNRLLVHALKTLPNKADSVMANSLNPFAFV